MNTDETNRWISEGTGGEDIDREERIRLLAELDKSLTEQAARLSGTDRYALRKIFHDADVTELAVASLESERLRELAGDVLTLKRRTLEHKRLDHPRLAQEVSERAQKFLNRINHPAALEYFLNGKREAGINLYRMDYFIALETYLKKYSSLEYTSQLDYDDLTDAERYFSVCESQLDEAGVLSDANQTISESEYSGLERGNDELRAALTRRIRYAKERIIEYYALRVKYRSHYSSGMSGRDLGDLDDLQGALLRIETTGDQERDLVAVGYDPRFIAAAEEYIAHKLKKYQEANIYSRSDAELEESFQGKRALNPEPLAAEISISGLDQVPDGKQLVLTEDMLRKELARCIPPCFLETIRSIEFKKLPKDFDRDGDDETIGSFSPVYDHHGDLKSCRIEIYENPFEDKGLSAAMSYARMRNILETVFHEIAHGIHHQLTHDEMNAWEEVMRRDPVAITPYVATSRQISERRGAQEDFAESCAIALGNISRLIHASEKRTIFVINLLRRYMNDADYIRCVEAVGERDAVLFSLLRNER